MTTHRERTRRGGAATVTSQQAVRTRSTAKLFGAKDEEEKDKRILAIKNYQERQITDPFKASYEVGGENSELQILRPHFDYEVLLSLPQENHTLKQCIEAMVTNIEGFGHRLEYIGPEEQMDSAESQAEYERIEYLLDQPNADYSLSELRKRCRMDKETIGTSYIEVLRNADGGIAAFVHIPGHLIRKTTKDKEHQLVDQVLVRGGKVVRIPHRKRFRRYVQMVGSNRVYFKEFGDPRVIDYKTGLETVDVANAATEIVEMDMYTPNHNYGLPRWINQLPAIIGSRECEITNLSFFKENAIPAMAILVSGGALTEGSTQKVQEAFTNRRGIAAMNRVLVIEALGDEEAADADGKIPPPKLDMKPLAGERQDDALFGDYDDANHVKIRSSFRLPPLFLGRAEDYTRASAEASLTVAEMQVFAPERATVDDIFNTKLLLDEKAEPPKYWRMRSNPAKMVSPEGVLEALRVFHDLGALTPNVAIGMANEMFNLDIEDIADDWGNMPFQMALQSVAGVKPALDKAADELDKVDTDDEKAKKAIEKVALAIRSLSGYKEPKNAK